MNMDKITNKIKFGISNINNLLLKSIYKFKLLKEDPKFIISEPPKIITNQSNDINIDRIKQEYRQLLKDFILTMKDNVSQELLKTMYNNLSTIDIYNSNLLNVINFLIRKIGYEIGGAYYGEYNKIKLPENTIGDFKRNIFHELLHMSSCVKNEKGIYSGFRQEYHNISLSKLSKLGRNINEGYTEILTDRYFNVEKNNGLYAIYKEVATIIENIIGKDKMTNLYFKSNLNGLIEELSKYSTKEESLMFIYNLDNNELVACLEYTNKIYLNKITIELNSNKITKEGAILELEKYINIIITIYGIIQKQKISKKYENIKKIMTEIKNNIGLLTKEPETINKHI